MSYRRLCILVLALSAVWPATAFAQVAEADANGFTIDYTVSVDASPETVWEALVQVGNWWHPDHSYWGDASAMTIESEPGGCFCEAGPDGAGAVHMTVLNVLPGQWLRLGGALGPLQEFALSGAMTITLEGDEEATAVRVLYRVAGRVPGGLESWAEPVGGVLSEAMNRLDSWVETGSPEPIG